MQNHLVQQQAGQHNYGVLSAGPGGFLGGAMFGSATDGQRMYVAINNRAAT